VSKPMPKPPANCHGARGLKRAGQKQYGRGALSNGWYFASTIPSRSKRGRRLRSLIDDYIEAAGGNASALAMDFYRSAALTQWEIDLLEAAPELDITKHRLLIGQRERLLRQANVLASTSHHDVPRLPEAPEVPEAATAAKAEAVANLFAAAETVDARRIASLFGTPEEPHND
jgi:hypothetical protein